MSLFTKLVVTAFTSAVLLVGGIFAGENLNQPVASTQSFGSFSPVQGQTYTLQGAGITATQNTVPLSSFTTPDGRAITMAMFGGTIGYGTLEPNTNSKIEDITFSGVTQNSNGSAVLTGVTRGNDFVTPYNASTTLSKAHAGGSYFILSNTAGFYGQQFLFANNAGTSSAIVVFGSTTPPRYDADPIWANFSTQVLADVSYVNSVVAAGAANASTIVKGIIQIATATQTAAGTATGSTGALLVPPNSLFNATQSATTIIPVTNTSGKLSQAFLDLTQAFSWTGLHTFGAGLLGTASSTFSATTSIQASNVLSNAVKFNGIPYAFPSAQGAINAFLQNNGSGVLSWSTTVVGSKYSYASTTASVINGNTGTASSALVSISAGTLTASSTIHVAGHFSCNGNGNTGICTISLIDNNGNTYVSKAVNVGVNAISMPFTMDTVTQQNLTSQFSVLNGGGLINTSFTDESTTATAAANWALATGFRLKFDTSGSTITTSLDGFIITVTP